MLENLQGRALYRVMSLSCAIVRGSIQSNRYWNSFAVLTENVGK